MSATPQFNEADRAGAGAHPRRDWVVRYDAGERTNHWLGAIAFVLAALSGLAFAILASLLAQRPRSPEPQPLRL